MLNRADFVIHAACEMMATHEADAANLAGSRATRLTNAPSDAAKWRLVADTIRMLTDDRFMDSLLPAQPYEVLRRH